MMATIFPPRIVKSTVIPSFTSASSARDLGILTARLLRSEQSGPFSFLNHDGHDFSPANRQVYGHSLLYFSVFSQGFGNLNGQTAPHLSTRTCVGKTVPRFRLEKQTRKLPSNAGRLNASVR